MERRWDYTDVLVFSTFENPFNGYHKGKTFNIDNDNGMETYTVDDQNRKRRNGIREKIIIVKQLDDQKEPYVSIYKKHRQTCKDGKPYHVAVVAHYNSLPLEEGINVVLETRIVESGGLEIYKRRSSF